MTVDCAVLCTGSMKRSSDVASSQPDISCVNIMDKFGLSSPTRASTAVRYRPSTSSASPSHLHHVLRSHGNASVAESGADMRQERREDGDGRSSDSIATCVVVAVSQPDLHSTTTSTSAASTTTPHHHYHHHHLVTAIDSDDDDDDDALTDRRRRRLLRLNTTTTSTTTSTTSTTTASTTNTATSTDYETVLASADCRTASTAALNSPVFHHDDQQQQQQQWRRSPHDVADVHSSVKISTQPSFSPVYHLSLDVLTVTILIIFGRDVAERACYQTVICYPTSPN